MDKLLPFQKLQMQFTAFIRDPEHAPKLPNVSEERLSLYHELQFNNILETLDNAFPICCSSFSKKFWRGLVKDFIKTHKATSPYFYEIPKEFLAFLDEERDVESDPEFLYELAHYEWVELALEVADVSIDFSKINRTGDLFKERPVISPLVWGLQYHYPVHKISKKFQPTEPSPEPIFLAVLRNESHEIESLEFNSLTFQLLNLLIHNKGITGEQALSEVGKIFSIADLSKFVKNGRKNLIKLQQQSIILGTEITDYAN